MLTLFIGRHVKCPLFLSCFNEIYIFSTDFSTNIRISHFIKIQPVGAEFHVKGRTDIHDEGNGSIFANLRTCLKMLHDKPSTLIFENYSSS
jgi:hypothetical protein